MESIVDLRPQQYKINHLPTVSVIVIFLNVGRFFPEAIESVFAQTYPNWELLLVDDGSSDESTRIARYYTERYPERVRYFEHPNHQNYGKTSSRNLGIQHAKGKYIAFLDADDIWLPQKLERQVTILDSNAEIGMVYGLSQWWYSWTGKPEDQRRDYMHKLGVPPNSCIEPTAFIKLFFLAQQAAIPTPSNILVRREIIKQVNGFDEPFRGMYDLYEDQAFYAKVGLRSIVFAANECWDKYRQHPDSSSSMIEKARQGYSTRLFFLKWLSDYLGEQEVKDAGILKSLRNEIWRCRHRRLFRLWQGVRNIALVTGRWVFPLPVRHWLWAKITHQAYRPTAGRVRFGNLRRLMPLSREFGYDRGQPIDRYYIEKFLSDHRADIKAHVLEIADDTYTRQFGGDRISVSDVLHAASGNPKATIIGDLTCADHIPSNTFDCIILTQTLQLIYDVHTALQTVYRILKPGGVVIATFPGISQISRYDMERWGYYWSFTSLSARRLFEEIFPATGIQIKTYGNVLTATAFLYGMATEELKQKEMEFIDQDYEVLIAVRAQKPDEL
jgi:glycosyltransferase involved in cell wall biosynthesis